MKNKIKVIGLTSGILLHPHPPPLLPWAPVLDAEHRTLLRWLGLFSVAVTVTDPLGLGKWEGWFGLMLLEIPEHRASLVLQLMRGSRSF